MGSSMNESNTKKAYEAPCVVEYGSLQAVTAGSATGNFLDQDFPDGTPVGDLTFS